MKFLRQLPVVTACLLAGAASAHDAWIEPANGGFQVVFGHDGKLEVAAAAKIKAVAAIDAKGGPLAVKPEAGDSPRLAVPPAPTLLTLHYDNGFWSKTTEGSKNLPRNEVPGALSASHAVKFGKTVMQWNAATTKAQGQQLEIVPLASAAPRAGAVLPVQVLWEGKPLAGAKLKMSEYTGADKERITDAAGKAELAVVKGRNSVQVAHKVDLPGDPRADVLSVSANLIFDLR